MKNKKQIKDDRFYIDLQYCSSIDNAINTLKEAKVTAKEKGFLDNTKPYLEIRTYEEYGSIGIQCAIVGKRLETNEECDARIAQDNKYKEMRRLNYENLKKEFEK